MDVISTLCRPFPNDEIVMNILNEELKVPLVTDTINVMKYVALNEFSIFQNDLFNVIYV